MIAYLQAVLGRIAARYRAEPVAFNQGVSAVTLWAALQFGFKVDNTVLALVVPAALSVLIGSATRRKVSPKEKA